MTARLSIEKVREILKADGYELLSTEYFGSGKKINLLCPQKHTWTTTLNGFSSAGIRCPNCLNKIMYNLPMVKELLQKEGYSLVTLNYENMHQKLEMLCPKGHAYSTSLDNFVRNGCRCFTCGGINRYTVEEIRAILGKEGYVLLTPNYKNAHQKLEAICPAGHTTFVVMNGFLSAGSRCQQCAPNRPHSISSIKEFVKKDGYSLVSTIYVTGKKLELICPKGHPYKTTFENFKGHDRRCPDCTQKGSSKQEREILAWVAQFYPNAQKKKFYYDANNGKKFLELDIYIPEINLGIEYCGLIWHCEKYKKNKNFHVNKMKIANKLGIRLIQIFGDEWDDRKDQIKNFILSVMGKSTSNIGARKTELRTVEKKEARQFLEENHIQGAATIALALGLYYQNVLVAVMTGDRHHRQGQEDSFILNRLAFKSGISIPGGSSRLLKALISYAKEKGYSKLVSWSDSRWSEGRVYEKMGFILDEEMNPDYSYVKRDIRTSKQSCQKKNLIKKGGIGNTEKEMALSLGLYRIWDCGKKRWAMDLSN